MKRPFIIFSALLLLFSLGACKKPILETGERVIPPLVLSTSIYDSLPGHAIRELQLTEVTGLKFKYYTGHYTSYFEYSADKEVLLKVLSELPFTMGVSSADTTCRQISPREIGSIRRRISTTELEGSSFFWNVDNGNVEVFECLKPPFRHIVQISNNSKKVLHRIEFLG
jgi:hypothetical protein